MCISETGLQHQTYSLYPVARYNRSSLYTNSTVVFDRPVQKTSQNTFYKRFIITVTEVINWSVQDGDGTRLGSCWRYSRVSIQKTSGGRVAIHWCCATFFLNAVGQTFCAHINKAVQILPDWWISEIPFSVPCDPLLFSSPRRAERGTRLLN